MASDVIASTDDRNQLLRRLADRERVRSEARIAPTPDEIRVRLGATSAS